MKGFVEGMGKTAVLFPGQGAQFFGMGKSFYDAYEKTKEIYQQASDILGMDMQEICFKENERLNLTVYTQPALLTTQCAILAALQEEGIQVDYYAGLSSGEYSAVVSAGGMDFADALRVIQKRGQYMQESVPTGVGMMSAIIGLDDGDVEKICKEISPTLFISNYNCPGQVVIAGYKEDVLAANQRMEEEGAAAVRPLEISVPSHCFLQKEAAVKLSYILDRISVSYIKVPYISNVTAEEVIDSGQVKPLLVRQLYSPVKWQQTLRYLIKHGVENFYEISADTSYKLMKYISRKVKVKPVIEAGDIN